uniref:HTH CENPB-type domain-containing protein n=1 Tax=Amphimedon queenslandica TaxID=400682 RepID=A0A1X7SME6_AMPQE
LFRRMEFPLEELLKCITYQNQLCMTGLISGCVQFGSTSGPESYLSEEERELVQFIEACTDIGFSRTKSQIIELVRVMMHKKKDVNVSLGWWTSFRRQHPHVVLRSPESVSHVRAIGTRPDIFQQYFDLLE